MNGCSRTPKRRCGRSRRPGMVPAAGLLAALAALGIRGAPGASAAPPEADAVVTVRTLIVDALGTRTVDTDAARIPAGGSGLLIKSVPYAGPPLSFRLTVGVGEIRGDAITLSLSTDTWPGDAARAAGLPTTSHREESTVLAPEGSYLLEIDHDPAADRRILLSLAARRAGGDGEEELARLPDPIPVELVLDVEREPSNGSAPTGRHLLRTLMGRPVSIGSRVSPLAHSASRLAGEAAPGSGVVIEVTPERARFDMITVRVSLEGSEPLPGPGGGLSPIEHSEIHTVRSGTTFLITVPVTVAAGANDPPAAGSVSYRIAVTPRLG